MRHTGTIAVAVVMCVSAVGAAAELAVGPGKAHAGIVEALEKAQPGDTILVHPAEGDKPYEMVAVMVRKERITVRAVPAGPGQRVALSGRGFMYSGAGAVPRAIFQFDPQAGGGTLEGFELFGAHNETHNGAGVRINQADNVTIRNCEIRACDMGIMSNGDGAARGANQRIESCLIHSNGDAREPGQNHNLYLGGAGVTLWACEVHSSLTGHNVKSRAHFTRVMYSYVHDSANREFDLVDAKGDTTAPGSDAVLLGNVIVKSPACSGNRTVIHFGQDGGNEHDGTLHLVHNTIVTPFISPVVDLSSPQAGTRMINNLVWDGGRGQKNQVLVNIGRRGKAASAGGACNWLRPSFELPQGAKFENSFLCAAAPPFVNAAKGDYHLKSADASIVAAGLPWSKITQPTPAGEEPNLQPLLQYKAPLAVEPRGGFKPDAKADLGAFGFGEGRADK